MIHTRDPAKIPPWGGPVGALLKSASARHGKRFMTFQKYTDLPSSSIVRSAPTNKQNLSDHSLLKLKQYLTAILSTALRS